MTMTATSSQFTLPAHILRCAFETALAFAEDDLEGFPSVIAVRVEPTPGGIVVAGTDRYVASLETVKAEGETFAVTVPRTTAERVVSLIPLPDENGWTPAPGLATFVRNEDDTVSIRVVGEDTATVTFKPSDWAYPDLAKIFTAAETGEATPGTDLHMDPDRLARAVTAIHDRDDSTPMRFVRAEAGRPLVLAQGDSFKALVMGVKVTTMRVTVPEEAGAR